MIVFYIVGSISKHQIFFFFFNELCFICLKSSFISAEEALAPRLIGHGSLKLPTL